MEVEIVSCPTPYRGSWKGPRGFGVHGVCVPRDLDALWLFKVHSLPRLWITELLGPKAVPAKAPQRGPLPPRAFLSFHLGPCLTLPPTPSNARSPGCMEDWGASSVWGPP